MKLITTVGLTAFISIAPFVGQALACPAGTKVVGHVQSSTGRAELKRAGLPATQLLPLQPVCNDDIVEAAANSATRIKLVGRTDGDRVGSEILSIHGPSRHVLPSIKRGSATTDNIIQIMFDKILPNLNFTSKQATARAGQPPRWLTPGLENTTQSLNPGRRSLSMAWRGGSAPFQIKIFNQDGTLASSQSSRQRELTMPAQEWVTGSYTVKLYSRDEQSPFLSSAFVVETLVLPELEVGVEAIDMGAENLAAMRALLMAQTDPSRFSLEAGQILSAAPEEGLDREFIRRSIANYSIQPTPVQN
ncbi:hypothetical protein [Aquidulcibacter sp.]|jgi:hypothetical protein|uniref:hypothetical protein n=1 Tax=Aquidulcibacter sp. TaxID=2052990 RepID=UPI0037BEDA0B